MAGRFLFLFLVVMCLQSQSSAAPVMLSNVGQAAVDLMENFSNALFPSFFERSQELSSVAEQGDAGSAPAALDVATIPDPRNQFDKDHQRGGGVRAPQILYSVTVRNPSADKTVNATVEFSDAHGHTETDMAQIMPGESRYFGQRVRSEGLWTSSMVISAITVQCGAQNYTLYSKDFGVASTTEHLSFAVTGTGDAETLGLKP